MKTYIADESGNYRFSGLDPNVDYEVHAEHEDLTSATRTVSSFNSSRDIQVVLKVSHKKYERRHERNARECRSPDLRVPSRSF